MHYPNKKVYLIRHAETAWSLSGQHTGETDIPLTKKGEADATHLKEKLEGHPFELVLCSPLQRAKKTCEIAGLLTEATLDPDLVEWNYGDYEGLTREQIQKKSPHWNVFSDGGPHGESPDDISARANKVLAKILPLEGDVALFSHGHFLRALAACWLGLPVQQGRLFSLSPCTISILGFERSTPVLCLWNQSAL
jgi:probable phosphoglycerate mutase